MFHVVIPVLAAAAKLYTYGQGGKVILKTTEAITGVPTHTVVSGFVDGVTADTRKTFQSVYRPVVDGTVFRKAYEATGLKTVAEPIMAGIDSLVDDAVAVVAGPPTKPSKPTRRPAVAGKPRRQHLTTKQDLPTRPISRTVGGLDAMRRDAANALASAGQLIADASARARQVAEEAKQQASAARRSELANQARAGHRLTIIAGRSIGRAQALAGDDSRAMDMLRYAEFARESAQAAMDPPTDPHDVLASDAVDPEVKERITTIIDALNRDKEPDYDGIIDMGVGNESSLLAAGGDHDEEHDCGGNCGQPCCDPKPGLGEWQKWGDGKLAAAPLPKTPEELRVAGEMNQWAASQTERKPRPDMSEYEAWGATFKPAAPPKVIPVDPEFLKWGDGTTPVGGAQDIIDPMSDDFDALLEDDAPACNTGFCRRPPPKDTIYRRG